MAVRDTLQIGDPRLKAKNATIQNVSDDYVQNVILDLVDTMRSANLIGMAAPQIGENMCLFVTEPRETPTRTKDQTDEVRVYINPSITYLSEEEVILYEGCGSVLKGQLFGPVKRPKFVTVTALNQEGKRFELTTDGLLGRVIQHEFDHLQGIEFLEKVFDYKQMMTVEYYIQSIKSQPDQINASIITKKEFKLL